MKRIFTSKVNDSAEAVYLSRKKVEHQRLNDINHANQLTETSRKKNLRPEFIKLVNSTVEKLVELNFPGVERFSTSIRKSRFTSERISVYGWTISEDSILAIGDSQTGSSYQTLALLPDKHIMSDYRVAGRNPTYHKTEIYTPEQFSLEQWHYLDLAINGLVGLRSQYLPHS